MSSCPSIFNLLRPEREGSQHNGKRASTNSNAARSRLTRVKIEALVSGDYAPISLGPELVQRLNHAWSGAGQRLHMLHVEVVNTPMRCPRCGDRALYRKDRRGFLQKKIYPLLSLFPWHCVSCRKSALLRLRSAEPIEVAVLPHEKCEKKRKAA